MERSDFIDMLTEKSAEHTKHHREVTGGTESWWHVLTAGAIRSGCQQCPLTFVANEIVEDRFDPDDWEDAADELGMNHADAEAIVAAADKREGYDLDLRVELIGACNPDFVLE